MCYFDILLKVLNHFKTQVDDINGISVWFGMLQFRKFGCFSKTDIYNPFLFKPAEVVHKRQAHYLKIKNIYFL